MDEEFLEKLNYKIKVRNGTTASDANLCKSCSYSHIRKGVNGREDLVYCTEIRKPLNGPIAECSSYYQKGQTSIYEYQKTAWVIDSNAKSGKIGFLSPKQWKEVQKERGEDDD